MRRLLPLATAAIAFTLVLLASLFPEAWAVGPLGPQGQTVPRPTPTPTRAPTPTATPTPTVIPTATATPTPVAIATVLPNETTVVDASQETRADVRLQIPPQTFSTTRLIAVSNATIKDLSRPLPPDVGAVRKPFQINILAEDGAPERHPSLAQCITLTVPAAPDDVAAARGDLLSLVLMRYDDQAQTWIVLTTQADLVARTLSAQVCQSLSLFGIGVLGTPIPDPPVVAVLPIPGEGGFGPSLARALLGVGLALLLMGALALRGDRR